MSPRDSAFATLGLRPGAARAQVDEAYRRLIKLHHPDRPGGDSSRAAELNRAYTLLRNGFADAVSPSRRVPVAPARSEPKRGQGNKGALLFGMVLAAIVVGGVATMETSRGGRFGHPIEFSDPNIAPDDPTIAAATLQSFDEPLHLPVINSAIEQAFKFHQEHDSAAAALYSRDCQNTLRQERNLVWFDACAAFDEATLTLESEDPLADPNGTEDSIVDARELAAAQSLSDDTLGADLRLHQIRSQVEFELVPLLDSAAAQKL